MLYAFFTFYGYFKKVLCKTFVKWSSKVKKSIFQKSGPKLTEKLRIEAILKFPYENIKKLLEETGFKGPVHFFFIP